MKRVVDHTFRQSATHYVRLRIPAALRNLYPATQTHVIQNLRAGDASEAKARGHAVRGHLALDALGATAGSATA